MKRTLCMVLIAASLAGCGGGGGNSADALLAGPLMFIRTQMHIYGSLNLQLADFNDDGFPELIYETAEHPIGQTVFVPGSETDLFDSEQFLDIGIEAVVADFDADGNLDMVSGLQLDDSRRGNPVADWLFVRGNGDNTFAQPVSLNLPGLAADSGLTVGDINADGFADLLALGLEAGITPLINQADGTFATGPQLSVPEAFSVIVSEDLNHDTFDDIIRYSFDNFNGAVDTYLSLGDGTFAAAQRIDTASTRLTPPTADLNNDGNHDILGYSEPGVVVALGAGDGTFSQPILTEIVFGLTDGDTRAVADFNEDGNLDLVFVLNDLSDSLYMVMGNGDGTFDPDLVLVGDAELSPRVTFGPGEALDVDRDGNLDLLIAVTDGARFLRPYFGNGDGTFRTETPHQFDRSTATQVFLAEHKTRGEPSTRPLDINGDGNLDIVAHNSYDNLAVMPGNGDLTFQPAINYPTSTLDPALTVDLDVDGDVDIFGPLFGLYSLFNAFRNYGDGELALLPGMFSTNGLAQWGEVADLDQDGLLDLTFEFFNDNFGVMYNLGDFQFEPMVIMPNPGGGLRNVLVDVTGDGYPDIVGSSFLDTQTAQLHVIPGGPGRVFGDEINTTFSFPGQESLDIYDITLTVEDFNADGRADIVWSTAVTVNPLLRIIKIFMAEPGDTFSNPQDFFVPNSTARIKAIDLDDDADIDLVVPGLSITGGVPVTTRDTQEFLIFLNSGSGEFAPAGGVSLAIGDHRIERTWEVVDVNGDDFADVVMHSFRVGLGIALGRGDGTFKRPNYFRFGPGMDDFGPKGQSLLIGDFDNDTDADFALNWSPDGSLIQLLENRMVRN